MAAPAGLAGQLGLKSESTVGTAVTVDTFLESFLSESIDKQIARLDSQGIRAGRLTTAKWKPSAVTVGGDLTLELWSEPLATLLTHMFGTVNTTGAGPFTHTAEPGDLTGKSFTLQVGKPDRSGTVQPFTYNGCKIPSWELACAVGEIPQLTLTISAWDEDTGTALAAASYGTGEPFTFVEGSLSAGGSAVNTVTSVNLAADNGIDTDRHRLGAATVKEQLQNGMREYTGTVEADFEDLTEYNRFIDGDEFAMVLKFDNGTDSLTVTKNVRYDGESPNVEGQEGLSISLPYKALSGTSDADAITAVLTNGESSAA